MSGSLGSQIIKNSIVILLGVIKLIKHILYLQSILIICLQGWQGHSDDNKNTDTI